MANSGDKDEDGQPIHTVAAFVDYEDFCFTFLVHELGITLAYTLMRAIGKGTQAYLDTACAVIEGYCSVFPLQDQELDCAWWS
jgi:Ser/Thr protein kinase RdoA (MazF antagonist)